MKALDLCQPAVVASSSNRLTILHNRVANRGVQMRNDYQKCRIEECNALAKFRLFELAFPTAERNPLFCQEHAVDALQRYIHPPFMAALDLSETQPAEFKIACIAMHDDNDAAAVYLHGADGRCLLLNTGKLEGWALCALLSRRRRKERPLSHEAIVNAIVCLGGSLRQVVIGTPSDGEYRATLEVTRAADSFSIDVRAVDGLALALAANVVIRVEDDTPGASVQDLSPHAVAAKLSTAGPILGA